MAIMIISAALVFRVEGFEGSSEILEPFMSTIKCRQKYTLYDGFYI